MSEDLTAAIATALPAYTAILNSLAGHLHAAARDAELLADVTAALGGHPDGGGGIQVAAAGEVSA